MLETIIQLTVNKYHVLTKVVINIKSEVRLHLIRYIFVCINLFKPLKTNVIIRTQNLL